MSSVEAGIGDYCLALPLYIEVTLCVGLLKIDAAR